MTAPGEHDSVKRLAEALQMDSAVVRAANYDEQKLSSLFEQAVKSAWARKWVVNPLGVLALAGFLLLAATPPEKQQTPEGVPPPESPASKTAFWMLVSGVAGFTVGGIYLDRKDRIKAAVEEKSFDNLLESYKNKQLKL